MPRVEESITIDRPPEDVFAFVTDPTNDPLWQSSTESSEIIDGDEIRPGARMRTTARFLGRRMEFTAEVTQHDPPKSSSIRTIEGPFEYAATYSAEPEGDGCRLTLVGETPTLGGFFGRISEPLVVKMYAREVRADLDKLKMLLEEGVDREA